MNCHRRKSFEDLMAHSQEKQLTKVLGAFDITLMGLGIIIGTGIFVLTGIGAAKYAGPGLMLSFVLAAVTCAFVQPLPPAKRWKFIRLIPSIYR